MKTLYLNCGSGASGDMIAGALLDLGIGHEYLACELAKLNLEGYSTRIGRTGRKGVTATKYDVITKKGDKPRHLSDIHSLIEKSGLEQEVKDLAKDIFMELAIAESEVHETPIERVHFHETGAIDSIIDIVSAAILLDKIDPDKVVCSRIADGCGKTRILHGVVDIPVPAVRLILKDAPVTCTGINAELTTPIGAAIIKTLTDRYTDRIPEGLKGYGAGTMELEIPNVLEAILVT